MAAGARSKNGNRTDYARHHSVIDGGEATCGNKRAGYTTKDKEEVDCRKCLKKLGLKIPEYFATDQFTGVI